MEKRIRAIPGGTSASKTISILLYLITLAQSDKTPTLTSIVSESFPHLKRGAMRDFLNILQSHNYFKDNSWNKTDSIYTFETGSKVEFFSADMPSKVRGARRDRLFINEANNVDFEAFEQLEVRTKDFVFIDWNPSSEFWYYTDVKNKRDDVEELTLTYKDNEALSDDIVKSIEQRKNRPDWWKVYGLGLLGELEGKIYTDWQIISEIPHEAKLERYGLNFGYSNHSLGLIALYYYNGGYIVDQVMYGLGYSNKNIADTLKNLKKALIIADSAEPKSIQELKDYGNTVVGCKKKTERTLGLSAGSEISYVKWSIQVVQGEKISITSQSIDVIREYRNYLWMVDKKTGKPMDKPEEPYHYSMDAVRYAVCSLAPVINKKNYINSNITQSIVNSNNKRVAWR